MSMNVKPGYLNPLTMMGKKTNALTQKPMHLQSSGKANDVQDLLAKQQSLQNQMILLKSTSDGAALSGEAQKAINQQLKEVSSDLSTAKAEEAQSVPEPNTDKVSRQHFDSYEKTPTQTESPGLYQLQQDEKEGYKVLFKPFHAAK